MKSAVNGAAGFLMKVAENLNPIPYPLFKSAIDKQIGWAAQAGRSLDFDNLAEAVKKELASRSVSVMPNKYARKQQTSNLRNWMPDENIELARNPIVTNSNTLILQAKDEQNTAKLFKWLCSILDTANEQHPDTISFTAELQKGDSPF